MRNRVELRYSAAFKRQVVGEVESGRFDSVWAASRHYGIKGTTTVRGWARQMGKGHLLAKVVRVEQVGEARIDWRRCGGRWSGCSGRWARRRRSGCWSRRS